MACTQLLNLTSLNNFIFIYEPQPFMMLSCYTCTHTVLRTFCNSCFVLYINCIYPYQTDLALLINRI